MDINLSRANRTNGSTPPIVLLGVPFDNITTAETICAIEQMVASRQPHYLATANVDFLVQAMHDVELRRILVDAHLVLCDGTPLLWASKLLGNPLPERVAGSDLIPLLLQIAAQKKYKVFFLGATPDSIQRAVENLRVKHPELIVAGHYSPPFRSLLEMDHDEIAHRIRAAKPDLLFVAFGCPKQEKWITMNYRSLGVPVSVGVGATIDFLAGTVKRAPRWMQKVGMEWFFRLMQEPQRLFARYARDMFWFSIGIARQWWKMKKKQQDDPHSSPAAPVPFPIKWQQIKLPKRLDLEAVRRDSLICENAISTSGTCLLELNNVSFIDSTGIGLLLRLKKRAHIAGGQLILVAPSQPVQSALKLMRLWDFFTIARDIDHARQLLECEDTSPVQVQPNYFRSKPAMFWRGEVTAANADEVWQSTTQYLNSHTEPNAEIRIDLSSLQFIDSTGVGLMIRAKKNAKQHGVNLQFIAPQPNVRNVLRVAKLESALLGEAA